ncbi:MAG: radical SAM protein [Synergistaceae bacterium]
MKYETLCLDITEDCNFKCPWCIQEDVIQGRPHVKGQLTAEAQRKLYEHIDTEEHNMFSFHGGECTLYPEKMLEIMDHIKDKQPKAKLKLFTNGSLLSKSLVESLNKREVEVCVSVSARGYKDVLHLIEKSNNPTTVIKNIKTLNKYNIRFVAGKDEGFAYEALYLHTIFECPIEIDHDYTQFTEWTEEDLKHFEKEVDLLYKLQNNGWKVYADVMGSRLDACDCPRMNIHFYTDGRFGRSAKYHAEYKVPGCSMVHKLLGAEKYKEYYRILTKYIEV